MRMRMRFALRDPAVRRSMVSLTLVLALALVPVACGGVNGDDEVVVATGLFERWMTGWNDNDPDALAELFTDDGTVTFEGAFETEQRGREEIRAMLARSVVPVSDVESTGPVTMADDGTFTCSNRYRIGDQDYVSDIVLEVEDGLLSSLNSHHEYAEDGD
ncbi:SgcJ/EcaC family oxidoreductase [Ilumatobacter sp.]|uniref:SgcJ/EcaC family oxidoreductase n=1 Tax=Ilumatobacter sp. TaxID=1967498 RepID=UPI003AF4D110